MAPSIIIHLYPTLTHLLPLSQAEPSEVSQTRVLSALCPSDAHAVSTSCFVHTQTHHAFI